MDYLEWIEEHSTLHWSVDFLYVVDGYEASLCYDGNTIRMAHGETIKEALDKLIKEVKDAPPTN